MVSQGCWRKGVRLLALDACSLYAGLCGCQWPVHQRVFTFQQDLLTISLMISFCPALACQQLGRKLPAHLALSARCEPALARYNPGYHLYYLIGFLLVSLGPRAAEQLCPGKSVNISSISGLSFSLSKKDSLSALGREPLSLVCFFLGFSQPFHNSPLVIIPLFLINIFYIKNFHM